MDIVNVAKYGNNCYSDLLEDFNKFKASILHGLDCLETYIHEFIKENSEQFTFSQEVYNFVENQLKINDLVLSLRKNVSISNNCINSLLKRNFSFEPFYEGLQKFFSNFNREFQEQIGAILIQKLISLESEERHADIEILDKLTIRRNKCSNGRWLIQCIQKKQSHFCQTFSVKFTVEGSDIVFGIAPFDKILQKKLELTEPIENSYFVRQDGIHFGFGLSEVEQESSTPDFTAKRNQTVLMNFHLLQRKIVLTNQTTGVRAEFEVPNIPENWCFIIGFRFQNEQVRLEK